MSKEIAVESQHNVLWIYLKRVLKKILKPLKPHLKRLALKVLVRLDDSFLLSNSVSIEARTPDVLVKEDACSLVVNEDGIITSTEVLNLNLDSIWPDSKTDYLEKAVKNKIRTKLLAKLPFADQYEFYKTIQKSFNDLGEDFDPNSETLSSMLSDLKEHEFETLQNKQAYLPTPSNDGTKIFWPNPERADNPRSIFNEIPYSRKFDFVTKNTPIGSAGSCFAMEIARKLQKDNFNYVVTESNDREEIFGSARWGTIFNVPSLRQLVEQAFGARSMPKILFTNAVNGKKVFLDPFREDIIFESLAEYEKDYNPHLLAIRKALTESEVFVMTLGMNEVWYLKSDGSVFSRAPWRVSSGLIEKRVLTVEENVLELQKMLDLWRKYNPNLKLILSVSPVPLHATFRAQEHHVIAANCHSKSTLRVAAEEFIRRNKDVYYFPSYESVMYCTEDAWEKDQRHVSRAAVEKVMGLFNAIFVKN